MITYSTGNLNNGDPFKPGTEVVPVSRNYSSLNASGGVSIKRIRNLLVKISASTGYRSPNLAELSSNGLHEGSVRYEIGNPQLNIERNLCSDIFIQYQNRWLSVFATGYFNHFLDYIYLQGTNEEYLGFRVYRYQQQNADIKGYESGFTLGKKQLNLKASYCVVSGKTADAVNLPFIPANRVNTELKFTLRNFKMLSATAFHIGTTYVLKQDHPSEFETPTPSYHLLYAGACTDVIISKHKLQVTFSATNILNEVYYDHLSRYKYYNIYNQGRSFNITLNYFLNNER